METTKLVKSIGLFFLLIATVLFGYKTVVNTGNVIDKDTNILSTVCFPEYKSIVYKDGTTEIEITPDLYINKECDTVTSGKSLLNAEYQHYTVVVEKSDILNDDDVVVNDYYWRDGQIEYQLEVFPKDRRRTRPIYVVDKEGNKTLLESRKTLTGFQSFSSTVRADLGEAIHIGETSTGVYVVGNDAKITGYYGSRCADAATLTVKDAVMSSCALGGAISTANLNTDDTFYVTVTSGTTLNEDNSFLRLRINTTAYGLKYLSQVQMYYIGQTADVSSANPNFYVWNYSMNQYQLFLANGLPTLGDTVIQFDASNEGASDLLGTDGMLYFMLEEADNNDVSANLNSDYFRVSLVGSTSLPSISNVALNDTSIEQYFEVRVSANVSEPYAFIDTVLFEVQFPAPNSTRKNFTAYNPTGKTLVSLGDVYGLDSTLSATNYSDNGEWTRRTGDVSCYGGSGDCWRYDAGASGANDYVYYTTSRNLEAYDSCNVTAKLYRTSAMDSGDHLCLRYSTTDGGIWSDAGLTTGTYCLAETEDTENTWHTITSANFRPSNKVTWGARGYATGTAEYGYMDDVVVSCQDWTQGEYWYADINDTYQLNYYNITRVTAINEYGIRNSTFHSNINFFASISGAIPDTQLSIWNGTDYQLAHEYYNIYEIMFRALPNSVANEPEDQDCGLGIGLFEIVNNGTRQGSGITAWVNDTQSDINIYMNTHSNVYNTGGQTLITTTPKKIYNTTLFAGTEFIYVCVWADYGANPVPKRIEFNFNVTN